MLVGEMMSHVYKNSDGLTLLLLGEKGLTLPQFVGLKILHYAGPQSVSAIAGCVKLSAAATSHMVDRLVGMGMVERAEDPDDRRQKRVAITPAGRDWFMRVEQEQTREFANVLGQLSADVQKQFAGTLRKVVRELAALPPPPHIRELAAARGSAKTSGRATQRKRETA